MVREPKRRQKKKPGRKPGKRVVSSPAVIAANRIRAWKHGQRAQTVTQLEVLRGRLEKAAKGAPEIVERYMAALVDGDMSAIDPIVGMGIAEAELMRRQAVDEVRERGVLVREDLVGADGTIIGSRLKQNPAAEVVIELNKQLGMTAQDQLLTRKARGEGAVDAALAMRLARDSQLRAMPKDRMPPPPPIETTAVAALQAPGEGGELAESPLQDDEGE